MGEITDEFTGFREKMNKKIYDSDNLSMKRFFNLDNKVYEEGEISKKTKEMLGLAASMVLRCDDCITYHIIRCHEQGVTGKEFDEIFNIALVAGGSVVIPHLRKALSVLEELEKGNKETLKKDSEVNIDNYISKEDKIASETEKAVNNNSEKKEVYKIYTDGACAGNPGPGGYAAIIIKNGSEKEVTGFKEDTTNNRMELMAVIEGLKELPKNSEVNLYADSNYVIKGIKSWIKNWKRNNWKTSDKKPVKNRDLWQELDEIIQDYDIDFVKVKAHTGNKYNEMADNFSRDQIDKNIIE